MRRHLFTLLSALSLLLFLIVACVIIFADFDLLAQGDSWQIVLAKGNAYYLGANNTSFDQHSYSLLPLASLLAVLPIAWISRAIFSRKAMTGGCHFCGYDLRATPEQCPECGTETKREKDASQSV